MKLNSQPGRQRDFINSEADIAIYGGAAGGGKSAGLLLDPILKGRYKNPKFNAVIFRRTSPQITNPGGLWDVSTEFYQEVGAESKQDRLLWKFPSGAVVKFAHMQYEDDKLAWQGSQVCMIGFDELTHFTESQFFYMMSRNRSTCGVKPYIRATTNPDPTSWVASFISWWIGQDGFPIPDRAGKLRWMVRDDSRIVWADTPEELRKRYPGCEPKSVTFIPAKLSDNPILTKADPAYLSNLMALDERERARLLDGNWSAAPDSDTLIPHLWVSSRVGTLQGMGSIPSGCQRLQRIAGLDVARFGDDSNVLLMRQGHCILSIAEWFKAATTETAAKVAIAFQDGMFDVVCVDGVGVGAGVVDQLRAMGIPTYDVQAASRPTSPRYRILRDELWCAARDFFRPDAPGYVPPLLPSVSACPNIQGLVADLSSPKYFISGGKFSVETKDETKKRLGRSPNYADALIHTFCDIKMPMAGGRGVRV